MSRQEMTKVGAQRATAPAQSGEPGPPKPSASIILISPSNHALLLHRVQTSSVFPSAHVFPGGTLSEFHDGAVQSQHADCRAFRLAAIRETFEESGILLARRKDEDRLLELPDDVREAARREVHSNRVPFVKWLDDVGGVPDVDKLIPFTRWITPHGLHIVKRFSTQMYLYMLPLATASSAAAATTAAGVPSPRAAITIPTPTSDGGLEHTAATFALAADWLARARRRQVILFPPQAYLLTLLSHFLNAASATPPGTSDYAAQRDALLAFLAAVPTTSAPASTTSVATDDPTALIPWADKVICPTIMFLRRSDGRAVLALDGPGPELEDSGRGGDAERVMVVDFGKKAWPAHSEVRWRREVLAEEKEAEASEKAEAVEGVGKGEVRGAGREGVGHGKL